jgi:hypothetical protein
MTEHDSSTRAEKPLATWRGAFIKALSVNANVAAAARAAEVSRQHCYLCRGNDLSFAEEWDAALAIAVEGLEERAWQRARFDSIQYKFTKTGEPILHPITGEPYYEHVGSDTMLLRLLEAHKPDLYKQRKELTGKDGAPLVPPANIDNLSREDLLAVLAVRRKLAGAEGQDT